MVVSRACELHRGLHLLEGLVFACLTHVLCLQGPELVERSRGEYVSLTFQTFLS